MPTQKMSKCSHGCRQVWYRDSTRGKQVVLDAINLCRGLNYERASTSSRHSEPSWEDVGKYYAATPVCVREKYKAAHAV